MVGSRAERSLVARSLFHAEAESLQPAQGTRPSNHDNESGCWLDLLQGLCFLSGHSTVQNESVFKMLLMCVCELGREGVKIRTGSAQRRPGARSILKNESETQRLDLASPRPTMAFTFGSPKLTRTSFKGEEATPVRSMVYFTQAERGADANGNCWYLVLKNPMSADSEILRSHKKERNVNGEAA